MALNSAQSENSLKRVDDIISNFKHFKTYLKFVKKPTKVNVHNSDASMKTGDVTGTLMYGNRTALPVTDTIIFNDNNTLSRVWTHDDDLN